MAAAASWNGGVGFPEGYTSLPASLLLIPLFFCPHSSDLKSSFAISRFQIAISQAQIEPLNLEIQAISGFKISRDLMSSLWISGSV
eukprot:1140825-Rhodomonas_salina.1